MKEYQPDDEAHNAFAKKRIKEFEGQKTFSPPDTELMKPAIDEIQKGTNVRAFIVAVETKDGIILHHKSRGSEQLMRRLNGSD